MKSGVLIVLFVLAVFGAWSQPLRGIYTGLEKMPYPGNEENHTRQKYQWFYLTYINFQGDSVFLEQMPVAIHKEDTIFSASDGGFYSYSGIIKKSNNRYQANLVLKNCDNSPMQMIQFTPPKAASDDDTRSSTNVDANTNLSVSNSVQEEIQTKTIIVEKVPKSRNILVDGNIYKPQ